MEQTFSTDDKYIWKMGSASYDRYIKPKMLFDIDNVDTTYIIDKHDWKTLYSFATSIPFFNLSEERVCFDKEAQLYSECAKEVDSYLEDFCAEPGGDMRQ